MNIPHRGPQAENTVLHRCSTTAVVRGAHHAASSVDETWNRGKVPEVVSLGRRVQRDRGSAV